MKRFRLIKVLPILALLLGAAVVAFPPAAHAVATLWLDDPGTVGIDVTVFDNLAGDSNLIPGVITYISPPGGFGVWTVNVTTGISNSPNFPGPATTDLNSVNVSSAAGGTLNLIFTDINFALPSLNNTAMMAIGGTTVDTVTYLAYFDTTNASAYPIPGSAALIGTLGPYGGPSFDGALSTLINTGGGLFSLTELVTITHAGAGTTSFNATLNVPVPPSALLLGSGLLGLGFLSWRRRKNPNG